MMFCKYCGKKLEYKDGKCLNCGSSLEKLESYREINIEKKEKTNKEIETKHEFDNEDGPIEIVYMPKEDHSIKFDIGKIKRAVFLVSFVVVGVLVIGGITFFYNKKNDIKSSGNNSIREESSAKINDKKDKSSIDKNQNETTHKEEDTTEDATEDTTDNVEDTTEDTTDNNGTGLNKNDFTVNIGPKMDPDKEWNGIEKKEIEGSENGIHFYIPSEWEDISEGSDLKEEHEQEYPEKLNRCEYKFKYENNIYVIDTYRTNNNDKDKYKIGSINNYDYWISVKITSYETENQEYKDDIKNKIFNTAWIK